jgi:hypothetical protein
MRSRILEVEETLRVKLLEREEAFNKLSSIMNDIADMEQAIRLCLAQINDMEGGV